MYLDVCVHTSLQRTRKKNSHVCFCAKVVAIRYAHLCTYVCTKSSRTPIIYIYIVHMYV